MGIDAVDRRHFLQTGVTAAALSWLPGISLAFASSSGWVTGFATKDGDYGVARLDHDLTVTPLATSDTRLHGLAYHPRREEIAAPARRPGRVLTILRNGDQPFEIDAPDNRHYCGHAAYAPDGRFFFATENDYDNERGVIGIYDTDDGYRRLVEFESCGLGPHEIMLHPNGQYLIVANGGIVTHPDTGRAKLNLDTMQPTLCLIHVSSGQLVEKMTLPSHWHQLSIRHMSVASDGVIAFGLQDQVNVSEPRPLVGKWSPGSAPIMLQRPVLGWGVLAGYVGSVAIDASDSVVAAACPRGNAVALWSLETSDFIGQYRAHDVCGVAPTDRPGQFLVTTGDGDLIQLNTSSRGVRVGASRSSGLRFDNHCRFITHG